MYSNRGYKLRRWDVEDNISRARTEHALGNYDRALSILNTAKSVAEIWKFNALVQEIDALYDEVLRTCEQT